MSNQVIIVGSGVAGLASAIRLAAKGFKVTILEKNNQVGGKLTHFYQDGFGFDAGPSLFVQPQNLEALFKEANKNINDYFTYIPVETSCHYFWNDGTVFKAYTNKQKLKQEVEQVFGVSAQTVNNYLQHSKNNYNHIGSIFLQHSLHKLKTLFSAPIRKAIQYCKWDYLKSSLHRYNHKQLRHPKLVQVFNRYATYNGSNPYKAPAMLSLIPHLELNEGTYYPIGGMISITQALEQLAKDMGVAIHIQEEVLQLLPNAKQNNIQQVITNKNTYTPNYVICNTDAYYVYKHFLNQPNKANHILKQERSSSAIIFYWGINTSFPQLHLHNILFSNEYEKEFDSIFHHKELFPDPTVYINITSKMEDGVHAPSGQENWFVMINAAAKTYHNEADMIAKAKAFIVRKINEALYTQIEQHIVSESVLHPNLIDSRTNSYLGSLYGTSSNSKLAAFLRHPNFSSTYHNLFFAGGSVHPGGGIPLCLQGAAIVSQLITQQHEA